VKLVDVAAGETIEILNVIGGASFNGQPFETMNFYVQAKYGELPAMGWQRWETDGAKGRNQRTGNQFLPVIDNVLVGPCRIQLIPEGLDDRFKHSYQVSYKITKPSAAGTTTSAPILLPPTTDAAKSWFVKLQVSSDLKTWDDVAPGQFLGSDTARFFRIQTTEAE
ncbi:hypothetical protein N9294_02705, partial [bacterium]|nr:hypothetical protein [bacterium]